MPSPILVVPGIGGSILVKAGQEKKRVFKDFVIDNRWMNISPLSSQRMALWHHDNKATLVRDTFGRPRGILQEEPRIKVLPGLNGIRDLVPEFELLARPYQDILESKFNYKYFGNFIDVLLATGLYERDRNLQAFSYDFRRVLDPHFRNDMFGAMKKAIENLHETGGPVVIVGHSLGAVIFKWFLTVYVGEKWSAMYVKRFIVVNAPFGGSSIALKAVLSGEYFVPIFSKQFHASLQLNSGIIMCFPNVFGYLPCEQLAHVGSAGIITPELLMAPNTGKNFNTPDAFDAWRELYEPHLNSITDPISVASHIVTCTPIIDTLQSFKLREVGGGGVEDLSYEVGDGQVPARSLNVAYSLFNSSKMLKTTIDGCDHINIVSDPRFAQLVIEEAFMER